MGKITEALKKAEQQSENQKEELKKLNLPEGQKTGIPEQRVTRYSTLEQRLKNRVYIAKVSDESNMDPRVVTYFDPAAPISEQYRILRTNIQSKSIDNSAKIFLITSAAHGEGKTVTAVNLAVSLAQDMDKKVSLVDCDLRNGNIHQLLNLNLTPGLSEVMTNGTASETAFHNSRIRNLTVLPRGEIPANPSELLGSKRMQRLLQELRSHFDYIIIDSPPVIPVTDAAILGAQTDGVVFIVQAQKTQEQAVKQAHGLLEQAGVGILGFVLTQTDSRAPDYYSYYYPCRKRYPQKTEAD